MRPVVPLPWLQRPARPGYVVLWHPESPGVKVEVKPCLLRRLRVVRGPFATLSETLRPDMRYVSGLPWLLEPNPEETP